MTLLYRGLLFLFVLYNLSKANRVIPHEPMTIIKSFLPQPSEEQLLLWKPLLTRTSRDNKLLEDIKEHTKHLIDGKAIILSLNGDLLLEYFPPEMKWNTTHIVPYPNMVTFIATSLSILLEGYGPDVLMKPLPELVHGKDVVIPEIFQRFNLMDLLGKTPDGFEIEAQHFLVRYETQAYVAIQVINSLLGQSLSDAWQDACMSLQLDNSVVNNDKKLVSPFEDLYKLTEVVHSDLTSLPAHSPDELPYDRSEYYVLGWWINGGYQGLERRLLDVLPADALISFSPTMQIFIIPSLNLSLVMVNSPRTSWNQKTIEEIFKEDNEIWRQVLMVSNPVYHDTYTKEKEERERRDNKDKEDMIKVTQTEKNKEEEEIVKVQENTKNDIENDETKEEEIIENNDHQSNTMDTILYIVCAPIKGLLYVVHLYLDFTASLHVAVRVFLFLGWIFVGHSFVSFLFHAIWFILRCISSRTFQPRPKFAGKDD